MKKGSTLILRAVIILIAVAVLSLCIFVLPEGIRSDNAGYYRPILMGMYIPAVPFFYALFQGIKLLNFIDKNEIFSEDSVEALRIIKYSGFIICVLYLIGMPFIFNAALRDDAPGVAFLGFIFIFGSLIVGTAAAVFQKLLQNVIELKNENELTV